MNGIRVMGGADSEGRFRCIYVMGGADKEGRKLQSTEVFDLARGVWRFVCVCVRARARACVCVSIVWRIPCLI